MAQCEELEVEVMCLRQKLSIANQRAAINGVLGHAMGLNHRRLQRKHADTIVENQVAKQILQLESTTKSYIQKTLGDCGEVDSYLENAQRSCREQMENLSLQWSEQQAKYESEMEKLQSRIVELQNNYNRGWKEAEETTLQTLDRKGQNGEEMYGDFQKAFAQIEERRSGEAVAERKEIEQQRQNLIEAQEHILIDMENTLERKKKALHRKVESETRRCDVLRDKQLRRASCFDREAEKYRKHIERVRASYRAPHIPGDVSTPNGVTRPRHSPIGHPFEP